MTPQAVLKSRDDVRYEIFGEQLVALTLDSDNHRAPPQTVNARLLNLSSRGARLVVPVALAAGTTFRLKLSNERLGLNFYLAAYVCWTSVNSDEELVVGCRLTPNIPLTLLQHLAEEGQLDRRESARRAELRKLQVIRDSGRVIVETVTLLNYAAGGICFETNQETELGERITIRFDQTGAPPVTVVVRWKLEQDHCYILGCEFLDKHDFARFVAALGEMAQGV